MADEPISALPAGSPLVATDQFVIARGGANYKVTLADIIAAVGSGTTPTLAEVLAAGADAGGIEITDVGAPSAEASVGQKATSDQYVFNVQSGAAYTLVLTDQGKTVSLTNAGAVTVTVPPNSSVAFPVGAVVLLRQFGGTVTVAPGVGVTVDSRGELMSLAGARAWATLVKVGTDAWDLFGDLA